MSQEITSWLKQAYEQVTKLVGEAGQPETAADAHMLMHLRGVQADLDQAVQDAALYFPPEEEAPPPEKTSAKSSSKSAGKTS